MKKFIKYIKNTWQNKILSVLLIALGYVPVALEKDGTALVFLALIAIPMFFSKENWIA